MMEPLLVIASTVVFAELELHSSRISLIIWFNVEVPNDVRYHQVKSGKTLADTVLNAECCLGGKLQDTNIKECFIFMNREKLIHWNDDEQGPNNQDGGADEQVPMEQHVGVNVQNADQDGDADEQVPNEQDGDVNEQPPNEQDIGAKEQHVYQDEGANGQVPNDQEGGANGQVPNDQGAANEQNDDQDGGANEQVPD
ncbi:hypothetical protein CQW23_15927 [Capsicum baccatum]|uniref:Uncharacterized protein n=1 Tax=Capsicum baccatum TaxID=33114 RepID=A0A2G2WNL8_CAPBA|nr:hypothetical protein CQW23_15927 [Capsicum baccatum]